MHIVRSLAVLIAMLSALPALAQEGPLTVAVKEAPPFVIDTPNGPTGLSIELWDRIADELDLDFVYEMTTLDDLIRGVADGRYDAGVGAISVTPDREEILDLTHGYFTDGLGVAVPLGATETGPWGLLRNLFTPAFLSTVGALALLLLVVGVVVWIVERRANTEHFNRTPAKGIGDGFWFAAVTMTTVGYGDKAPRTTPGRAVALVWMFTSLVVISAFTGSIASSLTAARIDTGVRSPEDLENARIGAIAGATSDAAMRERRISHKAFRDVGEGLEALASGSIDALVHDGAILLHAVREEYPGELRVLDFRFDAGSYAIALPSGSPLREDVNQSMLNVTYSPAWERAIEDYLGVAP